MDGLFDNHDLKKEKELKKIRLRRISILVVVFLIALTIVISAMFLMSNKSNLPAKELLINNIRSANIADFTDLKELEKFAQRVNTNIVETNTEVKINETKSNAVNTSSTLENTINFNNLKFEIKGKNNNKESKGQINLVVKHGENSIFNFDFLDNGKDIAIYEPSYFEQYLGIEKASLSEIDTWLPKIEQNLEEETSRNNTLSNLNYNLNSNNKMNIAKEVNDILNVYQKNLIKELEQIDSSKFKITTNIPTKYRNKDVKADNISLELSKEEYEKLVNNSIINTKKEITDNITSYPAFKYFETIDDTIIGKLLNNYVLPVENLGTELLNPNIITTNNETNLNTNLLNNQNDNNLNTIPVIGTENNSSNTENTQVTGEVINSNSSLVQDLGATSNNQENNLQDDTTIPTGQNTINLNTGTENSENNEINSYTNNENNINNTSTIKLNFYIIQKTNFKIDKVEGETVTSTIELYKENDKYKEIVLKTINLGKELNFKVSKTIDDNTVYNKIEAKEVNNLLSSENNEKVVTLDFSRTNNLDATNIVSSYKLVKSDYDKKRIETTINDTTKFVESIEIGTDKKIELLNQVGQEALNKVMTEVVYPQIKSVTSAKIYEIQNLNSIQN